MNWLEYIKPYTKRIVIDKQNKKILLVHPHFKPGKYHLKLLLKLIKQNQFTSYQVNCVGFISLKGALILKMIERYLNKLDNVDTVKLTVNISTAIYGLNIKFK